MFKKLFKPKWQSAKPQVRIQALQNLDVSNEHDFRIIELMAKGDLEKDVRLAAMKRIPQREKLISLIGLEKDTGVRYAAIEYMVSALGDPAMDIDPMVQDWVKSLDDSALAELIEHTRNQELGCLAIDCLKDESTLERFAVKLPAAQLRQEAASRLHSEEVLERVIKASKGKDKSVWRISKDRLNEMREEQQQEASIEQQLNDLCQNLETLSRLPYDNLYGPKLEHYQKQWQRLQHHADNEILQRFSRAFTLCKATIDDVNNEQNRLEEETRVQREALMERMAACEQLEEAVRQLGSIAVLDPSDIPALQALLNTQKTRWDEAATVVEPANDERKRFLRIHGLLQRALEAVRKLSEREVLIRETASDLLTLNDVPMAKLNKHRKALDSALGDLVWPEELAWPEALKLHQQALDHFERLQSKARNLEQDAIENIRSLFSELASEIDQGHLKPANRLLKEANQLIRHLPVKVASDYQKQLRELTQKVNELRDWQGFVATPKKEQLVRDMEALAAEDLDPQELSTRIRRLQDQWRALGEADKGRNKELWDRFSEAADKAYEPCRDYFEKLSQVRQQNLELRQLVCDQLQTYLQQYDWDSADWKAVNEVYETAKNEWRQYTPVERKEGKKAQQRFNDLLDQLRARLHGEFERNRKQREAIIETVEGLALQEQGELASAIEQVKQLQQDWKKIGMVARRDDSKSWKRFRAACDKVFERRDQKRQAVQHEREQNLVHAEHICEQIEQLAESDFADIATAQQEYRQLRQRYEALGPIPKEQQDAMKSRFKAVVGLFQRSLAQLESGQRQHSFRELWRRAALCNELEDHWLADEPSDVTDADWEGEWPLPEEAQEQMQQRYDDTVKAMQEHRSANTEQLRANEALLRDLCVRMEIAAGLESPNDDHPRRMALQMARLSNGLAQRGDVVSEQDIAERLQIEWCAVGAVPATIRGPLLQRFKSALGELGSR